MESFKKQLRQVSILFLIAFSLQSALPNLSAAATCFDTLNSKSTDTSDTSISISHERFEKLTAALRATISGNLATVFRSEWKTKLTIESSNLLIDGFARLFLSPETLQTVLNGLDLHKESFTRSIHSKLFSLKKNKDQEALLADHLTVRDAPPPEGTTDTTFTFYLRPLKDTDGNGEGKHQVRIRNYVRIVKLAQIKKLAIDESIQGFSSDGQPISIKKISDDHFLIGNPLEPSAPLTLDEIKETFGSELRFFAPHGGKYKLEIKTALLDKISDQKYAQLGGFHMVQKLDVSLTPAQTEKLFAPMKSGSLSQRRAEANKRVDELQTELINKTPANKDRITAVLNVLREGIKHDENFLSIEGATLYHRSAFESDLGFQLTVDRRQKVFHSEIYAANQSTGEERLRSPMDIMGGSAFLAAGRNAARHVELKLPFYAVQKLLGLTFSAPETIEGIQVGSVNPKLEEAVALYSAYVSNASHRGKFKFLLEHGTMEDPD